MRLSDNFACMNLFVSFLFVLASFVGSGLIIQIVVVFAMVVINRMCSLVQEFAPSHIISSTKIAAMIKAVKAKAAAPAAPKAMKK